jgi:hypothetical protein
MLNRIDRILIAVSNADAVAQRWVELLDARIDRTDTVTALGATRVVVSVGDAELEILQPTGPGPVSEHLSAGRGGPFAAGVATDDLDALRTQFDACGVVPIDLGEQLYLNGAALGIPGLDLVVSPHQSRDPVGLMANLYEATHLTDDPDGTCSRFAEVFGLAQEQFVPISSDAYGYAGFLTLFDPSALHRIETIYPADADKTMGRYFRRFGPSMYMCYGETDDLPGLRERLIERAPEDWTGSTDDPNGLFVHPRALGGVMLGVSRRSYAWTWSGSPDRVSAPHDRV